MRRLKNWSPDMEYFVFEKKTKLGKNAAEKAAIFIIDAINKRDSANIILATGISQFEMLENLVKNKNIEWHKVTCFHLDEYVGRTP